MMYFGSSAFFIQDTICPLKRVLFSSQFTRLEKHVTLCAGDGFSHLMPLRMTKIKQNLVLFLSTGAGTAQLVACPTEKPAVILTWVRVRDVARDKMLQRSFVLLTSATLHDVDQHRFALNSKWQLIQCLL